MKILRSLLQELRLSGTSVDIENSRICIGMTGVTFPYDALVDLPDELRLLDGRN